MSNLEYLNYSAEDSMTELRRKFNNGEDIYRDVPDMVSSEAAAEDVSYARYVLENAYSGYVFFDKGLFDSAFSSVYEMLSGLEKIKTTELIDVLSKRLSFISDGHLSFSTRDYAKGFYRKLQTYVSDVIVVKRENRYFEIDSGKEAIIGKEVRIFPTIVDGEPNAYLVGLRSKDAEEEISIILDGNELTVPLHKIKSKKSEGEFVVRAKYDSDTAIITCSSFIGDSEDLKDELYAVGNRCRSYKHVIWDLSNNLGGNSELPKAFLQGLTGGFDGTLKVFELKSTLVHAKECGEIREIPYCLEQVSACAAIKENLFKGNLHVILNDRVASSAEIALEWAAELENVTFYGCNSLGIGRFGDLCIYYLPNSGITIWCPQKVFDTGIAESIGFEPDYWMDREDVVFAVLEDIKRK